MFEKLKKAAKVSTKINLEMIRESIAIDAKTFSYKIFDWAEEYNFKVAGDEIVANRETINDFIDALEGRFEKLENRESIRILQKIMKVSTKMNLETMRKSLSWDKKYFMDKIYDWAAKFNFTVDGDDLIINRETVDDFIKSLERQFKMWGNQ